MMSKFAAKLMINGYHVLKFYKVYIGLAQPSDRVKRILAALREPAAENALQKAFNELFFKGNYHTKVGRFRDMLAIVRRFPSHSRRPYEHNIRELLTLSLQSREANLLFSVIMRRFLKDFSKHLLDQNMLKDIKGVGLIYRKKYKKALALAQGQRQAGLGSPLLVLVEAVALRERVRDKKMPEDAAKACVRELLPEGVLFSAVPPVISADVLEVIAWAFDEMPRIDITATQLASSRRQAIKRALTAFAKKDPLATSLLVLALKPRARWAPFLVDCARQLTINWQLPEALKIAEQAISCVPGSAEAHTLRAGILWDMGNIEEALISARHAVSIAPYNRGADEIIELLNGTPHELEFSALDISIKAAPNPIKAADSAARLLTRRNRADEGETILTAMIARSSKLQQGPLLRALGGLYFRSEQFSKAAEIYQKLLQQNQYVVQSHIGIAQCMLELNNMAKAETAFQAAVAAGWDNEKFDPYLMNLHLAKREFYDGLRIYRNRVLSPALRQQFGTKYISKAQMLADSPRSTRLLLIMESGPGDEVRIATLYPDLQRSFDNITATCEPRLLSLFERNFPCIKFMPVPRSRKEFRQNDYPAKSHVKSSMLAKFINNAVIDAARDADLVCSIYDIHAELRPDEKSFPRIPRLLAPLPELMTNWQHSIRQLSDRSNKFRIAINWRSMLQNFARNRNYFQINELKPLADLPNVEFWAFQPTMTEEEFEQLRAVLPNVYRPEGLDMKDDFEGMAAFLANMNLLIAPTTSNAELSAAVGTPTFILSNVRNTCWRRRADGNDIWYESSRVIIGTPLGDRPSQMASLMDEIRALMETVTKMAA
jgi:tetratricopeptide (TPR) repeat protein